MRPGFNPHSWAGAAAGATRVASCYGPPTKVVTLRLGSIKVNPASAIGTESAGARAKSVEMVQGVTAPRTLPSTAASDPPMPCWPSSKRSNYAALDKHTLVGRGHPARHNPVLGMIRRATQHRSSTRGLRRADARRNVLRAGRASPCQPRSRACASAQCSTEGKQRIELSDLQADLAVAASHPGFFRNFRRVADATRKLPNVLSRS